MRFLPHRQLSQIRKLRGASEVAPFDMGLRARLRPADAFSRRPLTAPPTSGVFRRTIVHLCRRVGTSLRAAPRLARPWCMPHLI